MRLRLLASVALFVVVAAACSNDSDSSTPSESTTTVPAGPSLPTVPIVFNGQGNDLAAYLSEPPFTKQIVIEHYDEDDNPEGLDINAQICFDPEHPGRFVAGEDTLQDSTGDPGWGIFDLEGGEIGSLSARQLAKLVPTYQESNDNPENYGCGFLDDGRILTTDIGNQAEGPSDGQLIVWFAPFEGSDIAYCKIDVTLATGQAILVDGDYVYVAQARPPDAGVYRYPIGEFPTSPDAAGGCDGTDDTGAPMKTGVEAEQFITPTDENRVATPAGLAKTPGGGFYVSSVFTGVISEFTADGAFVRTVLAPPAGEELGAEPFSTGTPLGIGVGPDGSLYYADIGIVVSDGIGPGRGTGTVRRLTFDADGNPQPPETMDEGLAFPDGIGIFVP